MSQRKGIEEIANELGLGLSPRPTSPQKHLAGHKILRPMANDLAFFGKFVTKSKPPLKYATLGSERKLSTSKESIN